ncbi:MAG: cation-binding protein, partial [Chitinivibrionales bacterium]|nr:cation-binding protein [Chitinivibrionales bacterium]MBD3396768.1 cation-binding protein [Chitinivibrionales bacterium]
MEAIRVLEAEHKLIHRMVDLMADFLERLRNESVVDLSFLRAAVDFIRQYADGTHRTKEEYLLFPLLSSK